MGNCNSSVPRAPQPSIRNTCQYQHESSLPTRMLVILTVPFHCPNCAVKVKRKLHDLEGVETVDVDVVNNRVTVSGTMDTASLVLAIFRKFRKHAQILLEREDGGKWRRRWERNAYKGARDDRGFVDGGYVGHHSGFYNDEYDVRGPVCHQSYNGCGSHCDRQLHIPHPLYCDEYRQNCSIMWSFNKS